MNFLNKLFIFFELLILFFFIGCVEEAIVEIPILPSKTVINCLFTPDSLFRIYLSETSFILNSEPVQLPSATIELYENDTLVSKSGQNNEGCFIFSKKPKKESVYTIKVLTDKGDQLFAKDRIPEAVQITKADFTLPDGFNEEGLAYYGTKLSFTDPGNRKNYYEIKVFQYLKYGGGIYYINNYTTDDIIIKNSGSQEFLTNSIYFNDELFNGEKVSIHFKYTSFFSKNGQGYIHERTYILLRSLSEEAYKFLTRSDKHFYNQDQFGEPLTALFKGEPAEMYSNIQGGLGIFAGYSQVIQELNFVEPAKD